MDANAVLINQFYGCFQKLDWRGMAACYSEDIFFCDPVFEDLQGEQVMGMWEMLLTSSKDLQLDFGDTVIDEDYGTCRWTARYTFSRTGRKVVNEAKAHFKFLDGRIVEHQDIFSLWKWSRQALGLPGLLLGWSPFIHNKVRAMARKSLDRFLATK
jgi:hypothetical protein